MNDDYEYEDEEYQPPSKSQIKREMQALQDLGARLTTLKRDQLDQLPISPELRHAIDQFSQLKSNEAIRRQRQFIGKVMRNENADDIQQVLERFDASSLEFTKTLHQLENWRDKLLSDDANCVTAFIEEYPETDIQSLRQLIRNTKKDKENGKNTGQYRKLFRFVKDTHERHRN